MMRLLDLLARLGARPSWARGRLAYRVLQTIVVAQGSSRERDPRSGISLLRTIDRAKRVSP